jgi:tyrosinase
VRLGPASPVLSYIPPNPQANGLGYNPRCIIRDISSYISSDWTNDSDIYNLITQYTDIGSFQSRLQGDFAQKYFGIHSGGHYTIRGDPGGDFFASPGDPYFFFQRECSCSFPSHHHSLALFLFVPVSQTSSATPSRCKLLTCTDSAIDRLLWTWQNLDLARRTNVIAGTITFNNTPPSRAATLQDPLDLSVIGTAGVLEIQNTLSTLGGNGSPFCYIYA